MSSYLLNGAATSIAPATVLWQPNQVGTDHTGAPVYSRYYNVQLEFDAATPPESSEWLNAASLGASVSLTIPNRWSSASFVTFSPVYLTISDPPNYETVNLAPFRIQVSRIVPE
jgi:hypothetical protein